MAAPLDEAAVTSQSQDQALNWAWQKVKLARHPLRPRTLYYIKQLCSSYVELHGDRRFGEDTALVGGLACFEGRNVVVVGQQKGIDTNDNLKRNFGMPGAEGYRKALRLFHLAAKFGFPVLSFIDTPGAFPGLHSEERGVAQAIAENLLVMADLPVPIVVSIIGEGGSGGALALGLGDRILMLENSIYSVASPEASATILWRDAQLAPQAAAAMKITAHELYQFGLIDEVVAEPPGGSHLDARTGLQLLREALRRNLAELEAGWSVDQPEAIQYLLKQRYQKFRAMGIWNQRTAAV